MKVKLILMLLTINSFVTNGQIDLEFNIVTSLNENGNVVAEQIIEIDSLSKEKIYNSTLNWVASTFANTESVMQSKIENKMVRINGISKGALGPYYGFYYGLGYTIQIDIKDNKIRFNAYNLTQVASSSPFTKTGVEAFYKKGKLRKSKTVKNFNQQMNEEITIIALSLKTYIVNGETNVINNDENW